MKNIEFEVFKETMQ